jgi:hypothetical protein
MSVHQRLIDFDNLAGRKLTQLLTVDEIYAGASQDLLSRLKEDSRIEWKGTKEHVPTIAEYLSMWANTPPDGGLIAIGVADDGAFIGCNSIEQKRLNGIEKAGHTHFALTPNIFRRKGSELTKARATLTSSFCSEFFITRLKLSRRARAMRGIEGATRNAVCLKKKNAN